MHYFLPKSCLSLLGCWRSREAASPPGSFRVSWYFLVSWLFTLSITLSLLEPLRNETPFSLLHLMLAAATYSVLYQLPTYVVYGICRRAGRVGIVLTVTTSMLFQLLLYADSVLFDLYGFHLNGFVWNLLTTPGGIASLGADQTNPWSLSGQFLLLLFVHGTAIVLAIRLPPIPLRVGYLVLALLGLSMTERLIYGLAYASAWGPILAHGDSLPLYQPFKMDGLLNRVGYRTARRESVRLSPAVGSTLNYPKHPIDLRSVESPPDILLLVAESLRHDLLTPEIMPHTYRFATKSLNLTNHYSGGNGTRQGMFSLIYGLYGTYWDKFLQVKRAPLLFDILQQYNYDYRLYTGASFTYPEFDQTMFRSVPSDRLVAHGQGEPWKRDVESVDALLADLADAAEHRPWFGFIFFESTHARYSFPPDTALYRDYLARVDYGGLSRKQLAPQIHGMLRRYQNAAHHVDAQIGRLLTQLKETGRLRNMIVIITGDHGEEFMENGRWGHNSSFVEQQVRTPMVVYLPGTQPKIVSTRTSHMDVVPTLMKRLGVQNPVDDYSLGENIAELPGGDRTVVTASWSDLGIINGKGKLVVPFKSTTQHKNLATDLHDRPVSETELLRAMHPEIRTVLGQARVFLQH